MRPPWLYSPGLSERRLRFGTLWAVPFESPLLIPLANGYTLLRPFLFCEYPLTSFRPKPKLLTKL